jgi:hypothetical protein
MPFPAIAGVIGFGLLKVFTFEVAKYVATRAFLIALCVGLMPIVIFKGYGLIMKFILNYTSTFMGGQGLESVTVQIIGVGAYLGGYLRIPEGISIFLGFCLLSFTLRMIRVK